MKGELVIASGKDQGKGVFLRSRDRVLIGRASSNDFPIDEPSISRVHCMVSVTADGCVVEDLDSRHGTQLNGRKLERAATLCDGDRIQIGQTELRVVFHLQEEELETLLEQALPRPDPGDTQPVPRGFCEVCGVPLLPGDAPGVPQGPLFCAACSSLSGEAGVLESSLGDSSALLQLVRDAEEPVEAPELAPPAGPPKHRLGRFEIHGALGGGAMGTVYKAWDARLERWIALKVMRPEQTSREKSVRRFLIEAKMGQQLQHPGILRCLDYGRTREVIYLAMEFLPGEDLHRLLRRRGQVELETALTWTIEVLEALCHAHGRKVIHRDIKPANLFLVRAGGVKILDFGLAKALAVSGLTAPGAAMGTPVFMPPEQLTDAGSADERADIYSVAATLFNLLTGEFPFPSAQHPAQMFHYMLSREPFHLRLFLPEAPVELEQFILRGMAKEREDRFQTAEQMKRELQRLRLRAGA